MEEAIEILWSYARREPLDSNGETIVPTINNSIAAIRILSCLEGWENRRSEKRSMNSEKRTTSNQATSHLVTSPLVTSPSPKERGAGVRT